MAKTWFDLTPAERRQTMIDEKKAKEAAQAAFIADSPNRIAAEQAAREAKKAAEAADKEAAFKAAVRASYAQANGSEWGFETVWPALRAEIVKQRTLENVGKGDTVDDFIQRTFNK